MGCECVMKIQCYLFAAKFIDSIFQISLFNSQKIITTSKKLNEFTDKATELKWIMRKKMKLENEILGIGKSNRSTAWHAAILTQIRILSFAKSTVERSLKCSYLIARNVFSKEKRVFVRLKIKMHNITNGPNKKSHNLNIDNVNLHISQMYSVET